MVQFSLSLTDINQVKPRFSKLIMIKSGWDKISLKSRLNLVFSRLNLGFLFCEGYFIEPLRLRPGVQKLTDMKKYRWTQKERKKLKNQHCLLSMLVPQIEYLYYPLNVEGVIQKGSLLPAHIKKQIIIILKFIYAQGNSLFC